MGVLRSTLIVSMRDRTKGVRAGLLGFMRRLDHATSRTNRNLAGVSIGGVTSGLMRQVAVLGGAYVSWDKTVGAAFRFGEQMAEVRKVLDPTPAEFKAIRAEILKMSTALTGIDAGGIAAIMAEAGQSGVARHRLKSFTEYTAKASVAFDMMARDAGDAFAKLGNNYDFTRQTMEHFGDTVNHLSNNMASKAAEIIEYSKRAAGSSKALGMNAEQMAAMGSAMIALGSVPETAGRAMTHFGKMVTEGAAGSSKVNKIFKAVGLSFKEWNKLKEKNGPEAMEKLFRTLKTSKNGAKAMLDLFGGDFSKDFSKLVNKPDILAKAFKLAADEARIAGSVQAEYLNKIDTPLMKIKKLQNNIAALGISIGDKIAVPLGKAAEWMTDILDTADRRVSVFDKMKAAADAFSTGLGFKDAKEFFTSLGSLLENGIFGKKMEGEGRDLVHGVSEDVKQLAAISNQFRKIGRDFRSFYDDVGGGDIGSALSHLSGGLGQMSGVVTIGGALGIMVMGRALTALSVGIIALARSPWVALPLAAYGISKLIAIAKEARGLGDFADKAKGWATGNPLAAIMTGAVGGWAGWKIFKGARNIWRLFRGGAAATGGPAGGAAKTVGKVAGGRFGTVPKSKAGLVGRRELKALRQNADDMFGAADDVAAKASRWGRAGRFLKGGAKILGRASGPVSVGLSAWDLGSEIYGDLTRGAEGPTAKRYRRMMESVRQGWEDNKDNPRFDFMKGVNVLAPAERRLSPPSNDNGKALELLKEMRALRPSSPAPLSVPEPQSALDGAPKPVSLIGTPPVTLAGSSTVTTIPSGVQQVRVTNPNAPDVRVTMTVTIHEATNGAAIAQEIGQKLRSELSGIQADTGWAAA